MPALVKSFAPFIWQVQLFGKPYLCRDGFLKPLFEVTGVQRPYSFPVSGRFLSFGPLGFSRPVVGRDENKREIGAL